MKLRLVQLVGSLLRVALRIGAIGCLVAFIVGTVAWGAVTHGGLVDPARFARPDDALTVVDRHGAPLRHARVEGVDRRWVPLAEISTTLRNALIAAEDAGFANHHGIDLRAVLRASVLNTLPWRHRSGASTITQQLVKLVYGRPLGVISKPVEMLRAVALERVFSKDEILEQYLNRLPYGDGIEGVARASEEYLGHSAANMTVAEAALIAGIPQAPSLTEPRRHLARAIARRDVVLGRMRSQRFVDDATWLTALHERPVIRDAAARPYEAARFVDSALAAWRSGAIERHAGRLETSLDLVLQRRTEAVLASSVERFQSRGMRNAAAIVVANATGEVISYVGAARTGESNPGGQLDLLQAQRQPGSTLKPFVYELLFERGGSAATVLDDIPIAMTGARGTSFEARDYDGHERGPVRARVALASSLNLAALDAARRVGQDAIVGRLRALGFRDIGEAGQYGAAVVLGGASVAAVDLARAYVTLARGGTAASLRFAVSAPQLGRVVMAPTAARVAWDILSDSRARSDAFGADLTDLAPETRFALKTGTSAGWHDAWAAVASEAVTVVVWMGNPDGATMGAVSGFEAAAPAAVRILAAAQARASADGIAPVAPPPVQFAEVEVCAWTGLRAGHRCQHTVHERFAAGTIPRERCEAHEANGAYVLPPRYAAWAQRTRPAGVAMDVAARTSPDATPVIHEPRDGARWLLDPTRGETAIALRATIAGVDASRARWEVDGRPLVGSRWVVTPGAHRIVAIQGMRRSVPAVIDVRVPNAA